MRRSCSRRTPRSPRSSDRHRRPDRLPGARARAARARRPDRRAARPDLADPALGRHAPASAPRRTPRVPCRPVRAEDRSPEEAQLAAARPLSARHVVRDALLPRHGRADPPHRADSAPRGRAQRFSVPLLAAAAEAGLRRLRGRAADRARDPRRLLHLVLQRLARQPQPLQGAEEGSRRVHAADGDRPREPGAVLRRLPRRDADLDRPRPPRLVPVGSEAHAGALRRPRGGSGPLERLRRRDDRRRRAVPRPGPRPHLRASRRRARADDAPRRRADRNRVGALAPRADVQRPAGGRELERPGRGRGDPPRAGRRLSRRARRRDCGADCRARRRPLRAGDRPMKILFVLEHPGVGPLVPALRLLHERGHEIHLAARRVKSGHSHNELQALADECERITYTKLPSGGGSALARDVRYALDYRRYLEPRYRDSPKLRARAAKAAPGRLSRVPTSLLRAVERSFPPSEGVVRYLRREQPDVVLVTPLVDLGSRQADWLRAARRLGIRTGYPVFSWDNLTNKGLVRDEPDLVLVWNDLQAREAEELHGISPSRIRITGAPVGDPWFEWQPSRSREEFCAEVGLDPARPIVLYLCSSEFVAPDEVDFVPRWIERLRSYGGTLAEAGYLIRPYPDTAQRWLDA